MIPVAKEVDKTVFRPSQMFPGKNVVTVWENGKKKYFEVDPDLYDWRDGKLISEKLK